ncbi:hypothetical protein Tco_0516173 [Tanacetum coccineum]
MKAEVGTLNQTKVWKTGRIDYGFKSRGSRSHGRCQTKMPFKAVNLKEIKMAALENFAARFKKNVACRPKFRSARFCKLFAFDDSFLESTITINEIKSAVWECDGSKASGPDGFNFKFIKTYWDVLKDEVVKFMKYFEISGNLASDCNPSFIVLIPKISDTVNFSNYRPVAL